MWDLSGSLITSYVPHGRHSLHIWNIPDNRHDTDLACEGVGHPGELDGLGHVVPQLLLGRAVHVGDAEVDGLVHQFTLLPGDGLAALLAGPHLIPLLVSLPEGHAVLLGHVTTLGNLEREKSISYYLGFSWVFLI